MTKSRVHLSILVILLVLNMVLGVVFAVYHRPEFVFMHTTLIVVLVGTISSCMRKKTQENS